MGDNWPYYILDDDHNPVPERDILKWAEHWGTKRFLFNTEVPGGSVSSIFLGIDHGFGSTPPLLFESAIIRGDVRPVLRYATYAECQRGHEAIVRRLLDEEGEKERGDYRGERLRG